jgi:hypothetical protein
MFLFDNLYYIGYHIYKENDMGLDNYWMKNKEELGTIEGEFKVCGGMLSGHGNDSFRGKVYHRFVEDVTEVSLYGDRDTNEIPIETVKKMADDLEATEWRDSYIENYDIEEEEFRDLVKMFRLHADAGHYLVSSW